MCAVRHGIEGRLLPRAHAKLIKSSAPVVGEERRSRSMLFTTERSTVPRLVQYY